MFLIEYDNVMMHFIYLFRLHSFTNDCTPHAPTAIYRSIAHREYRSEVVSPHAHCTHVFMHDSEYKCIAFALHIICHPNYRSVVVVVAHIHIHRFDAPSYVRRASKIGCIFIKFQIFNIHTNLQINKSRY